MFRDRGDDGDVLGCVGGVQQTQTAACDDEGTQQGLQVGYEG